MDASACPTISFTVPGIPVPWARAGSKGGIRFTPRKQRDYGAAVRTICAETMRRAGAALLDGPVQLSIRATYVPPASWSQKKRAAAQWRIGRPDADNLGKLVADNLNGVAWVDDAQVVSLHIWKTIGDRAELVVEIRGLG